MVLEAINDILTLFAYSFWGALVVGAVCPLIGVFFLVRRVVFLGIAVPQFAAAGDYHLRQISPCIDSGDNAAPGLPSTDRDGNPRVVDGDSNGSSVVDMGAYEFEPAAPPWGAASTVRDGAGGTSGVLNASFLILVPLLVLLLGKRRGHMRIGKSK